MMAVEMFVLGNNCYFLESLGKIVPLLEGV